VNRQQILDALERAAFLAKPHDSFGCGDADARYLRKF
jgi:hypothetical protein